MCNERTQRSRVHNELKYFLKMHLDFAWDFHEIFLPVQRTNFHKYLDTRRWDFKGSNAPSVRISPYCCGKLSINRLIGGVLAKKPIFRGEGRGNLKQKPEEEMRTNFPLTVRLCFAVHVYLNNGQHMRQSFSYEIGSIVVYFYAFFL